MVVGLIIPAQRDGSVSKQIAVQVRNCKHKNMLGISGKKKLTLWSIYFELVEYIWVAVKSDFVQVCSEKLLVFRRKTGR